MTRFLVNPASDNGATGRRWPTIEERAAAEGLRGATLFTLASLRGVGAACLLVASNTVLDVTWLDDDELQAAVDGMAEVALATLAG